MGEYGDENVKYPLIDGFFYVTVRTPFIFHVITPSFLECVCSSLHSKMLAEIRNSNKTLCNLICPDGGSHHTALTFNR